MKARILVKNRKEVISLDNPQATEDTHSVHYTDMLLYTKLTDTVHTYLSACESDIVVLCIGTDRSTGDALGPLTGTFLKTYPLENLRVYGCLHHPVHALNLEEKLKMIHQQHQAPFILAVDASLGKITSVGHFISGKGPLLPGAALKKILPKVGDAHITGVVNMAGMMQYNVLQSTKLSLVYDMAKKLAQCLFLVDRQIISVSSNKHEMKRKLSH